MRVFLLLTLTVLLWAIAAICPARSDEGTIAKVKLNHARMCANEAGLSERAPLDCPAIWQVTTTVARIFARRDDRRRATPDDLLTAQQALSSRVTGAVEMDDAELRRRRNARWSTNLTWSDAEPAGWDEGIPWEAVVDTWRSRRRGSAALVDRFVETGSRPRVCDGYALGWGGPGLDDHVLDRRNFWRRQAGKEPYRVLDCGDTHNAYFGLPRRRGAS